MKISIHNPFNLNVEYASFNERISIFQKFVLLLSALAHFSFGFLFLRIGVTEMVYFNFLFSVPYILLGYFLSNQRKYLFAWIVFYTEVALHALFGIYFVGWECGFQFYLLSCAMLIHIAYGWKTVFRWIIFVVFLLLYLIVYFLFKEIQQYALNENYVEILYAINILFFVIISSLYIYFFMLLMINFEKKLKQNNKRLNHKNKLIEDQKDEIETQRDLLSGQKQKLEEIHEEITDSIDYATRIQKSLLPSYTVLHENIKGLFVVYKPKFKVSGDFYWWTNIENHSVITAADCTGHGVPGAFMSMLGISYLREIVTKEYITHPGVILRKLRKEVVKSLKQKGDSMEQKDGMDLGLISINHENNLVQYAGANNSVYIIASELEIEQKECMSSLTCEKNNKTLYEIKPDKMPIGIYRKMDKFTMHEFTLSKGDIIYLFSDGFADQFGGLQGKKFMYKPFKKLLLEISDLAMFDQKEILSETFEKWKGDLEQVDDVVIVGIQL